jgi:SAM-dependent methyltransferase
MATTARVTTDHLVVPARVAGPVVVTFDGQYVWSFSPGRDGVRAPGGWQVAWPEAMRPRLAGTTRVRLGDSVGELVLFDDDVAFGGTTTALVFRDPHGHPLAVDKCGHLTRVFSETGDDVRSEVVEGTARAIADLRDRIGIDAHLSYGCLLGAVREGRMIGHDSDSDLAYLSEHTSPADVIRESFRIERELRVLGWKVVRMSGADLKLFLPLRDGRTVHIDIFAAFHVDGVFYQLGGRSGRLPREAMTPPSTVVLEGVELPAPADPEAVLAFLYGPSWRVPDPAFQNTDPPAGIRRLDGWLRGFRTHVVGWNELLRGRRAEVPKKGSGFAAWTRARLPGTATVVELGSGNGRDAAWFARQGYRVQAFDFSGAALRQTRRRIAASGAEPDVRVLVLNDVRAVLLAGAELSREAVAPHLYARGLIGCLDADARRNLWRLCAMTLRRGGALYAEVSAARADLPAAQVAGLVRRVDVAELTREIESAGGIVVHLEHGPGHDIFDQPDPHVARLEVRWPHPDPDFKEQP